ncbi:hypothetical protein KRMM14A1259_45360 [Krasilnikovia sp. MM14-A1259]
MSVTAHNRSMTPLAPEPGGADDWQDQEAAEEPVIVVTVRLSRSGAATANAAILHELVGYLATMVEPAQDHCTGTETAEALDPVEPDLICIDLQARRITRGGAKVDLRQRDFDLLAYLAQHPRQVFTRRHLLTVLQPDTSADGRTVDVHISRIRQKLHPGRPVITTVHGIGYRLATGAPVTVLPTKPRSVGKC